MRLDHLEFAQTAGARGLELSIDGYQLAEFETVLEIGAIEPHAFERTEPLAECHLEDRAAACTQEHGAADFAND